ncbi:GatB/YqeY domain-containing protein [Salidesulfovibrio onnuriiensis]|uniref:GatB/YqeY domain-containing protein n=1 Tax=Salidesulfovibrio onnuriiensis TaxID=2583823 RepID=UPI0011C7CC4A|nr:GatB/YqeY domain-containing protein [Salidesulfovibrio onnuriiensis]
MSLLSKIEKDYIEAYKAKNTVKVAVLRHLKTAIKNRMVEVGRELADEDVLDLVSKQVKQRKDSMDQYEKAGRQDLADVEKAELVALDDYMPKQMSEDELAAAVEQAVADTGASSMKDMGTVMKALTQAHKGQFDGGKASALVKARLSS